ncbi:hypothetical protein HQ590_06360 [bacterium]|nr:hypothetical protein [bacterium]
MRCCLSLLPWLCCLLLAGPVAGADAPRTVEDWLQRYPAEEFTGPVWARCRLLEPAELEYAIVIDGETNPYTPARRATGTVSAKGLKPREWEGANDWGKPLAWYPPAEDEWLTNGQDTVWVALPQSRAREWFVVFVVKPRQPTDLSNVVLQIEFATQADEAHRFRVLRERPLSTGGISVRLPSAGGEQGLRMVQSFAEWTRRRAALVDSLQLGPPPKLEKFILRSYLQLLDDRVVAGRLPRERVELDFRNFQQLGLNSIVVGNIDDPLFAELAAKHGIIHAMVAPWAENWRYTAEHHRGDYNFQPDETVTAHWRRVFDDFYGKYAARLHQTQPHLYRIGRHVNLGDEIGPATNAKQIRATPAVLAYFRQWLAEQGTSAQVKALGETWSPALFSAAAWKEIEPLDDPAARKPPQATDASIRRFYWTRRFMDHYTELFYGLATAAAQKYFPHATSIDVNYQAGPMQMGFLGNDNAYETMSLDTLEMGRRRTFLGVKTEDWYGGNDFADGACLFGAEILRAAARKHDLPLTVYLVGTSPYIRTWLYVMAGVREIDFYQYGPYSNIGPAWAEHEPTLRQIAQVSRELAQHEDLIAAARRRPTKAAMLVAYTTDIMQGRGPGFGPERQQLYVALQHAGIPVDVVSETDITEENLLAQYSLLYVGDPQVRADAQQQIAAWVNRGGVLWAEAGALGLDEYGRSSPLWNNVFGVRQLQHRFQPGLKWARPFYANVNGRLNYNPRGVVKADPAAAAGAGTLLLPRDVRAWGARVDLEPDGCEVLARYDDGAPAVVVNQHGRGRALLVGALVGEAYSREHWPLGSKPEERTFEAGRAERALLRWPLRRADVAPPLWVSVPGLYTAVWDGPDATLVFLVNASTRPVPSVAVKLVDPGRVRRVESMQRGKLTHRLENGHLVVELPLDEVDVVIVRHRSER